MCEWFRHHFRRGHGISLLVPFRADVARRAETWEWLAQYWRHELPGAHLIVGSDKHIPFCKTMAVNEAYAHSRGDIIVILDADCYLPGSVILTAAKRIRRARRHGRKLWFIPYRHFYRLTDAASQRVLHSDPADPYRFPTPPPPYDVEDPQDASSFGHWWGALIQIMPRKAFEAAGGMDSRFQGWGGDDVSFMFAVDTLYARHKTLDTDVLHLWHPKIGQRWDTRKWEGQAEAGTNNKLAWRYIHAKGQPDRMLRLTREEGA